VSRLAGSLAIVASLTATWQAGPPTLAAQETHALVVVGLGGSEEYREQFHNLSMELYTALTERYGLPPDRVVLLGEKPELAPDRIRAVSSRDNILSSLAEIAARARPQDRVMIVVIGHGTAQGEEARVNLTGPDLSGPDLAVALSAFSTQPVAVILTESASGGFVQPLSGPNRVIVAATRTVRERNFTEFARFFVQAVTGDGADLDKDGAMSVLEAYLFARAEVERHYQSANELLTEHAILDDNGDGEGSHEASLVGPDGQFAATFQIGGRAGTSVEISTDPVLAALYEERRQIQERIDGLRTVRESMPPERYDAQAEELLVELALKTREIRAREESGAPGAPR
jgi:hypothetical protein